MPRLARLDAPGVIHHVMIRGIERRKIFRNQKDCNDMMDRLTDLLPATNTTCYAWAFLSNHAHFLFRSGDTGLSTLMRRLLTGYVVNFNRRYKRHGQLFQNRYKSIICQEDIYLRELVRYIHLNPLRSKVVSNIIGLNRYKYSGHSALMGKRQCSWQDKRYVLSCFGKSLSTGRDNYYAYQIDREELYSKGRQKIRAEARALFCYWAVRELGYGQAELGRRLGMTQPGVGYAVQRGEHIVKENNFLIEK